MMTLLLAFLWQSIPQNLQSSQICINDLKLSWFPNLHTHRHTLHTHNGSSASNRLIFFTTRPLPFCHVLALRPGSTSVAIASLCVSCSFAFASAHIHWFFVNETCCTMRCRCLKQDQMDLLEKKGIKCIYFTVESTFLCFTSWRLSILQKSHHFIMLLSMSLW